MHPHLQKVREFHEKFGIAQAEHQESTPLADMDIVMRQALLLECGSDACKAIAGGDSGKTLAGLVDLAYNALAAIACRGDDVLGVSAHWRQDGSVLTVARLLSEKIHQCSSGEIVHYSALYSLCEQLARGFLNADFDKAMQILHNHIMSQDHGGGAQNYEQRLEQEALSNPPDLTDAFYE
ncbi:MAG: nucleoside triphosphate pyrophosphohydrolase family protein [Methylomonas sp.]|jgi:hypothetical protein